MKFKLAVLLLCASVSAAAAADVLPGPAPAAPAYRPPPVSPAYNWTGFYLGAMGGYGRTQNVTIAGFTGNTNEIKGAFGGGTIGYNWQAPGSQIVFGLETDAAWSDVKFRTTALGITFEDRIRAFGSTTARVGFAADAALFYLKGGYAWADNRMALTSAIGTLSRKAGFIPDGRSVAASNTGSPRIGRPRPSTCMPVTPPRII